MLRFGIDPIGLLVPFLIFAIGVSHGVQKISAVSDAAFDGLDSMAAARRTFPDQPATNETLLGARHGNRD